MMREKLFTIRMTDDERARAERVAKHYGLNVAGVIRMLLKREDDANFQGEVTRELVRAAHMDKPDLWLDAAKAPNKPAKKPAKGKR